MKCLEKAWDTRRGGPDQACLVLASLQEAFNGCTLPIQLTAVIHWACRELLKEKKVAAGARWSKTKDSLAGDKRYKALARDQREHIFRQYVAEQEVCTAAVTLRRS